MVKIFTETKNPQTKYSEVHRANGRVVILCSIALILATLACNSNPHFGISTTPGYDPDIVILVEPMEESTPEQSVSIPEPVIQPETSQGSDTLTDNAGTEEFSVTAQDFTCICQVDGNVNVELRVNGDQLEVVDPDGGMQVYEKIGDNTYKRSWMGYYIMRVDGKDTTVDEEKSVVITLNDDGYTMEHYSGAESSPCCIHTFTQTD